MKVSEIKNLLESMENCGGATIKNNKLVSYKTGYQVADYGIETTEIEKAIAAIIEMNGNVGIWYENGIFYIDHSFRVKTKKDAIAIGKKYNQISILKWSDMSLIYC